MVESIIHAVDQYQSQASGADIRYKMGQKAKNGGTIGPRQARLSQRPRSQARGRRDPHRRRRPGAGPSRQPRASSCSPPASTAPRQVLDASDRRRTHHARHSAQPPPGPVSLSHFYVMLTDPYYCGVVRTTARSTPAATSRSSRPEMFDRVQRVLALRGGGGTRQREHHHWLKGLLWCAPLRPPPDHQPGKGNGGTLLLLPLPGRQDRVCDQPYLGAAKSSRPLSGTTPPCG